MPIAPTLSSQPEQPQNPRGLDMDDVTRNTCRDTPAKEQPRIYGRGEANGPDGDERHRHGRKYAFDGAMHPGIAHPRLPHRQHERHRKHPEQWMIREGRRGIEPQQGEPSTRDAAAGTRHTRHQPKNAPDIRDPQDERRHGDKTHERKKAAQRSPERRAALVPTVLGAVHH